MGCVFYFFLTVTFFSVSEVSLLLYVAQNTGIIFTMACCVLTGILGGYFVRQQGLATLSRIKQTIEQGALPADEAIEALLLLIVGVLLCVPGFITDFLGFMIIIPPIRAVVAKAIMEKLKAQISAGTIKVQSGFNFGPGQNPGKTATKPTPERDDDIENATIIEESNQNQSEKEDQ